MSSETDERKRGVEYVTQVHIHTTRFSYPPGMDKTDLSERVEADIHTEVVFRGHKQITAAALDGALPEINLSECSVRTGGTDE